MDKIIIILMGKKVPDEIKFDEDLRPVEFEELEKQKRRYRSIGNFFVIIIILAAMVWLGLKFYQRWRNRQTPGEEPVPTQNLWVPGIDYQPQKEEGN